MNSQAYKEKFGVSKTAYKNMVKKGLLQPAIVGLSADGKEKHLIGKSPTTADLAKWREMKKARKAKIRVVQKKNYADALLWRRTKSKPSKRRDGKTRGSVGPRSH
jgi:hypothetical protein